MLEQKNGGRILSLAMRARQQRAKDLAEHNHHRKTKLQETQTKSQAVPWWLRFLVTSLVVGQTYGVLSAMGSSRLGHAG